MRRVANLVLSTLALALLLDAAAEARESQALAPYPTRPIRIVTASSPGTAEDFFARALGEELSALYRQRVVIDGDQRSGYVFEAVNDDRSSIDALTAGGFCENVVERRPELDRWTLFHTRGPQERHLCQLDYIFLSPALAASNATAVPDIVRGGQPWRTPFPPGQEVERYPRTGWDRPKASDHCPVAVTLDLV